MTFQRGSGHTLHIARFYRPGEEMEIDIHGKVADSTARPSPSFSGALYLLCVVSRDYFGGMFSRLGRMCFDILINFTSGSPQGVKFSRLSCPIKTQSSTKPLTPLTIRSTVFASHTHAAGADTTPPSPPTAQTPTGRQSPSDSMSNTDRFILNEVVRHEESTQSVSQTLHRLNLSQPVVWDDTHYKRISPRTCTKFVKPFLRCVDRDFRDTSARVHFRITGVYLVTPHDTTLVPTYCYQHAYPQPPTYIDDYEHELCHQALWQIRLMLPDTKAALIDELKSLSPDQHNTWETLIGKEKDVPKGCLILSKPIFSIVYNSDGTFEKYKTRLW